MSRAVEWRELRRRSQPRRGLLLYEAALYLGIDARVFGRAVSRQIAPQPRVVLGLARWDIVDLDRFFDEQPRRGDYRPEQAGQKVAPRI